jgi:hypothetical protein
MTKIKKGINFAGKIAVLLFRNDFCKSRSNYHAVEI